MLGYCETRDLVAWSIVELGKSQPELTREQLLWRIGQMGPPESP